MSNVTGLRATGVNGIVLTYAKEAAAASPDNLARKLTHDDADLSNWVDSNLQTIEMLEAGDYIALRITGAGPASCDMLERYTKACTTDSGTLDSGNSIEASIKQEHSILEDSMRQLCAKAYSKGVRILIDAEGSRYQRAIDQISLDLMPEFNTNRDGRATILNTYQLYLKSNIEKIKRHLQHSVRHNYLLGLKLVRGAYMYVEPNRDIIHDTKQGTDDAYDAAVKYLLSARADGPVENGNWNADIVLATHNTPSVQKALRQYMSNANTRERIRGLGFAQLMGMADELSLSLAAQLRQTENISTKEQSTTSTQDPKSLNAKIPEIGVYKYTVWGTLSDCLLYMLRRAEENSDAAGRSRATVLEVLKELTRRIVFLGR
ncbi:hypothetical protein H2198_004707 [Neophaeococcomyces mojaviensis]|uniref:Uncharacterized protein n=1 Tax=Neophaeococcomyces mojaviensis TaxID=3383035 RepID=A0ACC3A7U6_9EURO|nr:hypothetical protein H2198_004707 [Knufia sp. JES_112]